MQTDYGSSVLSRGILPATKLWWIFAEDSRVCKHPLFILGQNPPEFSPAGENSVPRQGRKPFDLKVKLTYRANAPLNQRSPKGEVFTRSVFKVWIKPFAGATRGVGSRIIHRRVRSSPEAFIKFGSSLFKGLRGVGRRPAFLVAARRGRKPLYGIFFLLIIF